MMINILDNIFSKMKDNAISKAESDCENGITSTYQCFFKNNHIIVVLRSKSYTAETINNWGSHDNDFATKSYDSPFFKIQATKDDYINLMVWYLERKHNHIYEYGKDIVNSLHFNLVGDD